MLVEYVAAMDLRVGDQVIPDTGIPICRVVLHRLEGAPPHVVVRYAEIPRKEHLLPHNNAAPRPNRWPAHQANPIYLDRTNTNMSSK